MNTPRRIRASPVVPRVLKVFDTRQLALEHLCDHVLTRPEAHDWALLLPDYQSLVDPGDDLNLRQFAATFWQRDPPEQAQRLYERYADAIQEAVDDAIRLGWYWEERHSSDRKWCALGLSGVYAIWDERVIRTAMLLPNAELLPSGPPQPREVNPLPRRNSVRLLSPPPPDTPGQRYALFEDSYFCVRNEYARASSKRSVTRTGGQCFSQRPPRRADWERLIAGRPKAASAPSEETK